MKRNLLLPTRYKLIGLFLFLPGLAGGIWSIFYDWEPAFLKVKLPTWLPGVSGDIFQPTTNYLHDEIALTLTMAGLLLMAFSREPKEDEFIRHTRLVSLQWAFLASIVVFVVASWVVFNDWYWYVLLFNMISTPLFFLVRFHWVLRQNAPTEE